LEDIMSFYNKLSFLFMLFFVLFPSAGEMEVPASAQAELAMRILFRERAIRDGGGDIVIGMADVDGSGAFFQEMKGEFEKLCAAKIDGKGCTIQEYFLQDYAHMGLMVDAAKAAGVKAIYFAGIEDLSKLPELATKANTSGVISIGRKREWVQGGLTYGIFLQGTSPRVYINSESLKYGGFVFEASLLRLAELVK
jgi:hypothetical protein